MSKQIAIDGPAGSGKSTVARIVARRLGFLYIDTGAMYRAMGLYFAEKKEEASDPANYKKLVHEADISFKKDQEGWRIYLNGRDVSRDIRTEEAGMMASNVAKIPEVREKLVALQQKIAESHPVIMDGRDIGTVVLREAGLKIYLEASARERASRRAKELKEKGIDADPEEIEREMTKRDLQDKNRSLSPLKPAEDAIRMDSSRLSQTEVAEQIIQLAMQRFEG